MNRYRVWLLAAVLAVTVPFLVTPAQAWEFNMDGNFTWEYEVRGQTGKKGFFGPYDIAAASGTGGVTGDVGFFAPFNAYIGQPGSSPGFAVVSGSDGAWNTQYMTTNMELRVNPALRIRGVYYIGEWFPEAAGATAADAPFAAGDLGRGYLVGSEYVNNRFGGIQRSFSPGYWNQLYMNAQLPWGEIAMGKRPSVFGIGLQWNGTESRSSEALALAASYGPLRIVFALHPARRSGAGGYYNADYDKNNGRLWDMSNCPAVTYRNGPVDMGFLFGWGPMRHRGGESQLATPLTRITTRRTQDDEECSGAAYLKYNNGRFFFNIEGDFDFRTLRFRQGQASGTMLIQPFNTAAYATGPTGTRDEYFDGYRAAVEMGTLCGPAKVGLLYAWLSGPDRRYGHQINRSNLVVNNVTEVANVRWAATGGSNTGLFRPYSYLMVYAYGLGTHINDDTYHGYVEDASIYASRVDYAVAANLNVYGSFMWADRVSKSGYGWGFLKPSTAVASLGQINKQDRWRAPSIPDTNLGWEVDAGFDWKLLEGLLINATFGYWQPGNWWKFACIDKSVPNWDALPAVFSTNPATWGINPDRTIDPIWGLELKVSGQF